MAEYEEPLPNPWDHNWSSNSFEGYERFESLLGISNFVYSWSTNSFEEGYEGFESL